MQRKEGAQFVGKATLLNFQQGAKARSQLAGNIRKQVS